MINKNDPLNYLRTGEELTPMQVAKERNAIEDCIGAAYREAIRTCGMNPKKMAQLRMEQLEATKITHIKMRGNVSIVDDNENYKIIAASKNNEETLIELISPDWSIRERAMSAIEIMMGYSNREEAVQGGTLIIVQSQIPSAKPPPDPEILEIAWQDKK